MKKFHLLFVVCLCYFGSTAQVEIREFSNGQEIGNDISGTEITLNVTENAMHMVSLSVKNVSGGDQTYVIERWRIEEVFGWEDGLCWGPRPDPDFVGQCYTAQSMNTNPWTTPTWSTGAPNYDPVYLSNQAFATIIVDVETQGPGCAHYRYYVKDGSTLIDSVDLVVCSSVSIAENVEESLGMITYPNPVNNYVTITTTSLDGNSLVYITDLLGKVVYAGEMNITKKIDMSEFKNGVYLITLTEKGLVQTKRIIVKHD